MARTRCCISVTVAHIVEVPVFQAMLQRTFHKVDGHLLELLVRQAPSAVLEVRVFNILLTHKELPTNMQGVVGRCKCSCSADLCVESQKLAAILAVSTAHIAAMLLLMPYCLHIACSNQI